MRRGERQLSAPRRFGLAANDPMIGQTYVVAADRSSMGLPLALRDLRGSLRLWPLWTMLGWIDVKQRYRRAFIGPFWISISMGIMVASLGLLYGALFQQDIKTFLPFIAGGFVSWFFISSCLTEGAAIFVQAEGLLKQGGLPISLHVFRLVWRNIIIFLHNSVVIIGVYLWSWHVPWDTLPLVLAGLVLVTINLTWMVLILGPLCTRFRDLPPIVANIIQLMFFLTPIVFIPGHLKAFSWVVRFNPFFYMVESIRGPFLGEGLAGDTIAILLALAAGGWVAGILFFARSRGRIVFWL